jgi:recombination protein RecT
MAGAPAPTTPRAPAPAKTDNSGIIAIRDQDIPNRLVALAPEFRFLFPGKPAAFDVWMKSLALCVIENKDLRAALTTENGQRSFIRVVQKAASTGLSLNPLDGEAAIIPFGDGTINYWPMKNGIIKGAMDSGEVETVFSKIIYEKDTFTIEETSKGDDYRFCPALEARGKPKAYFAVIVLKSGRTILEYMTKEQVEAHRDKYGKGLSKATSVWNTNFDAMAEKTVLKALLRRVHVNSKTLDSIIEIEEEPQIPEAGGPHDVTPPKGTSPEDLKKKLCATEPQPEPDDITMKLEEPEPTPEPKKPSAPETNGDDLPLF